jgi:transcriptional regulator with XRE-family HTH domain
MFFAHSAGRIKGRNQQPKGSLAMAYLKAKESQAWLRVQLDLTGIRTLDNLARVTGIHKGTLSKYFSQKQRPTVDVVAVLCRALKLSPREVLYGLGAIDETL